MMINVLLLDLVDFDQDFYFRFSCLPVYCNFSQCVFHIRTVSAVFYDKYVCISVGMYHNVCDSCVICAYHGHREITNREQSQSGLELPWTIALIRQNKLEVCIILGFRASYGVLFLSHRSQSVQFNATILKRMVSTF